MNKLIKTIYTVIFTLTIVIGSLGVAQAASADKLIDLTNTARTEQGLADLSQNDLLTSAAFAKANDMFSNGYFAHVSPVGKTPWDFIKAVGYNYTYAGENLAIGYTEDKELHEAWMNSASHRENILNGNFRQIGIAVVDGEFQGAKTTLVVQMFGTPVTAPVIAPIAEPQSAPKVASAQSNGAQVETSFQLNRDKTKFAPNQIFAGEKVEFSAAIIGDIKTITIAFSDQKIDLLESSSIKQEGETKTYSKEIQIEKVGNWPINLTVMNATGQTQTMEMGNLLVSQKAMTKAVENTNEQVKNFLFDYGQWFIGLVFILAIGMTVTIIYRRFHEKPVFKF